MMHLNNFLKKLTGFFYSIWPVLVLVVIEIVLFKTNYIPGTWLTGWDSNQPEFNFHESLVRNLNAVWQEYRGLGLLDGMAHAATLGHIFYTWIISFFVPLNVIRYVFVHLMHLLGGMGVYFLMGHLLNGKRRLSRFVVGLSSAIIYMFNPGVISMFFVPFELFIIHFGFLPWLLLSLIRYLQKLNKRNLIILFLIQLLAVSQAHVPTIFVVYAITVGVFLLVNLVQHKFKNWKPALAVVSIIFCANSFWFIPYAYSAIKNAGVITNSKINVLSNKEIVLRNEAFGDLKSLALFQSFNLDYEDLQKNGEYGYQFDKWREHWLDKKIEILGYILFSISLLGLILALVDRSKSMLPFSILFFYSALNLGSKIFILSWVRDLIYKFIPYYEEIFRFAFTKFIILYSLVFSVFVGYAIHRLINLNQSKLFRTLGVFFGLLIIFMTFFINKPSFKGQFIYDNLQVQIPNQYFELFTFFSQKENDGRILILPQPSMWNWEFDKWGYRGSGIIWQGINNPTMHRSFDPWSKYNEESYLQLTESLAKFDLGTFEKNLNKYGISWVIIDPSIYQPSGWPDAIKLDETTKLLNSSKEVMFTKYFENISVYKVKNSSDSDYITSPRNYWQLEENSLYMRLDPTYQTLGNYISKPGMVYPFLGVYSDREIPASIQNDEIVMKHKAVIDYEFVIPKWLSEEIYAPVDIFATYKGGKEMEIKIKALFPTISVEDDFLSRNPEQKFLINLSSNNLNDIKVSLEGKTFDIKQSAAEIHLTSLLLQYDKPFEIKVYDNQVSGQYNLTQLFLNSNVRECWKREGSEYSVSKDNIDNGIRLISKNASACASIDIGPIPNESLGVINLNYVSSTNTPPHNCFLQFGESNCQDESLFEKYGANDTLTNMELKYELNPGNKYWFDLTARGQNEINKESRVEYRDIVLSTYRSIGKINLTVDRQFVPTYTQTKVAKGQTVTLRIPLGKDGSLAQKINLDRSKISAEFTNCDNFNRGTVEKIFDQGSITFNAKDKASLCEYLPITNLLPNVGYFLRLSGENISGRPFKFVVNSNLTRQNEIEFTSRQVNFDSMFLLTPPTEGEAYDFNIESRSFGGETGSNKLKNLEFIPVPVKWLSNIRLVGNSAFVKDSSINIIDTKKAGASFYRIIYSPVKTEKLLVLNQAFETGWLGFAVLCRDNNILCNLKQKLPFLFGTKLEHFKANSWANAFIVPANTNNAYSSITIFYWPQYLEYLGLLILVVTPLIIIILPKRSKIPTD